MPKVPIPKLGETLHGARGGYCPICNKFGLLRLDFEQQIVSVLHSHGAPHTEPVTPDQLYTIVQAARLSGVAAITIYKAIERRELSATQLDIAPNRKFITAHDLAQYWQRPKQIGWRKGRSRKAANPITV